MNAEPLFVNASASSVNSTAHSVNARHFAGLHGPLRTYSMDEMLEDPDAKMLAAMSHPSASPATTSADFERPNVQRSVHHRLDELEAAILDELEPVHMPVVHTFTAGLYCRRIFMPAGTVLTSKEHLTEHQYVILAGVALVTIPGEEPVRLAAPHSGVTRPGTRRALLIEADCTWATYHPLSPAEERLRASGASESQLLACIEERIIGQRERYDGRDVHQEYKERLAAKGLPGPNEGQRALKESV